MLRIFPEPVQFEWDAGNRDKNRKHGVGNEEAEQIFFDVHKRILKDVLHSKQEERYLVIGATRAGRVLFVVCTIRQRSVRIISARTLSKKERQLYEKEAEAPTI